MRNEEVDLVREIVAEHEAMKRARQSFEKQWDEVIELALPRYRKFAQSSDQNPGEKRTQEMFDATPLLALRHFAAAMDSMITPRTQKWHKLTVADEGLREVPAVRRYLDNGELAAVAIVRPAILRRFYAMYCAERTLNEVERDFVRELRVQFAAHQRRVRRFTPIQGQGAGSG